MERSRLSFFSIVVEFVLFLILQPAAYCYQPYPIGGGQQQPATDTVYVDDFNRADGPLGADWLADSTMQIVSNELDNTDPSPDVDDIAIYVAHTNPIGVAIKWSPTADSEGIDQGGMALMLTGTSIDAYGYFLYKNDGNNSYYLWTVENGAITTRVTSVASTLPYPMGGEEFQVVMRSDLAGHHFDVFYNDQFDVTVTDPYKLQGNGSPLYCGVMLGGSVNNNVDEFTFVQYDDDSTPPDAITDLEAIPYGGTSMLLRWTAPGDDGSIGTAGSYDVRFATYPIDESNWSSAIRVIDEPQPAPGGSPDSLVIENLSPETEYWFAIKTSDGFPRNNISGLSNVASGQTLDNVPPNAVSDLAVVSVQSSTVLLSWTAPGDSDTLGTATSYDVRFAQFPITPDNFANATKATHEPTPDPYGTYQEYSCNKLRQGQTYYFAMKSLDEQNNRSDVSNVVSATTLIYPWAVDDFERPTLGDAYWVADPELQIVDGELANVSSEDRWDFSAIFTEISDVKEVNYVWGDNVNVEGTSKAGVVMVMDSQDPDANGYLIFRHSTLDKISLWDVSQGVPSFQIDSENSDSPDPTAGDWIRIAVSSDINGNHFDYWINNNFEGRVSDPDKLHPISGAKYSGLMINGGGYNNSVESFWIASLTGDLPPAQFSLFLPFNGDTVDVGTPLLDWYDSYDLNQNDSVYYSLWYGTDPLFYENTEFVDSIWVSEYQIPGGGLGKILADYLERESRKSTDNYDTSGEQKIGTLKGANRLSGSGQNSPLDLPDDAQIFWRVRATDTTGLERMADQMDWSFFVSIPDAPLPFDLILPPDNATVNTRNPKLVWHAAVDPDPDSESITYEVWYDRQDDFGNPTKIGGIQDTSFTLPTLLNYENYYWKVLAEDEDGLVTESVTFFHFYVDTTFVGIDGDEPVSPGLPKMFTLGQNYPNPFNPRTSISYDVPETVDGEVLVRIDVFSVRGIKIKTLVEENKVPGRYEVVWDGTDDHNQKVSSGIYFYRMKAGDFISTKKMVILK